MRIYVSVVRIVILVIISVLGESLTESVVSLTKECSVWSAEGLKSRDYLWDEEVIGVIVIVIIQRNMII